MNEDLPDWPSIGLKGTGMAREQVRIEKPGTFTRDDNVAMSRPQVRSGLVALGLLLLAGLFTLKGFLPALVWAVVFAIGL